jgi:zinc and cadmium transporter
MSSLGQVIFFSLIGGVFSLIGGFILLSQKKTASKLAEYATPFAAGALLAAAFIDLLAEGAKEGEARIALTFALVGIVLFFLMERFLHWFHHHHEHDKDHMAPNVSLVVIGDVVHNFIDGIAIAAGFLVSPETGMVVTVAVAAHEIPQEIGDFGLLLSKGMDRVKVIWVNVLSALATVISAVLFFQYGQSFNLHLEAVLGLVAGFFIYIAASDVIPTIHHKENDKIAGVHTVLLVLGVLIVSVLTTTLHESIESDAHTLELRDRFGIAQSLYL